MFDAKKCRVERTDDQNYLINWSGPKPEQKVAVYMTENPDDFYNGKDLGAPLIQTSTHEIVVSNPDKSVRHYFCLKSEHDEKITLAERQLSLEGSPNFRDLGGYETSEGRRLKWGKLYRSGKLSTLTHIDIHYINRLGVSLVCDFRQTVEQELDPTWLGDQSAHFYAGLPVTPGSSSSFMTNLHNGIIEVDNASRFMQDINRDFVINQLPQYAEMFRLLLEEHRHMLIHCASGKDRTGFGAALLLKVLGVDRETIIEDYLLTNSYLPIESEIQRLSKEFKDHSGSPVTEEILRPLVEVRPEYLRACFEEIDIRYESKQHFFEEALKLDEIKIEILKDRYLD